ncbi:RDD family protein [Streptomyces sp. G1]|uniref:RDD family protein n=1 Tax=Streptomyces sp. G1 TaxID=361572 RepID=UPI00202E2823|nr:RDD family protein [Streptomyces sp. G1]MCM1967559.1 RDD family protein [Streptomyces sp. G1]
MTASPGDGEHAAREGYYPDPSIPGYVRFWNGLNWVPGTSRPAAPADETGPVFLDQTGVSEALRVPEHRPQPRPAPAPAPAPVPAPAPAPEPAPAPASWPEPAGSAAAPAARSEVESWSESASRSDFEPWPGAGPSEPEPGSGIGSGEGAEAAEWQADPLHQSGFGGPRDHRVSWGHEEEAAARPAGISLARPPVPAPTPHQAQAHAPAPAQAQAAVHRSAQAAPQAQAHRSAQAPARHSAPAAVAAALPAQGSGSAAPGGLGILSAPSPVAAHASAAAPAPAPVWPAAPGSPGSPDPEPAERVRRPERSAPAVPAEPARRVSPVEPADRAERAEAAAPPAPRPERTGRAVFERMAERAVRPAGLVRRATARLLDSLVYAAVATGVALPLVPGATAHLQAKVDAARAGGRTTTVWLLDGTIAGSLGLVLGAVLLFGVFYEALPTARWGRTPGKKLFGVRVLATATLRPPRFGAALRRWLVYALLGLPGALWALADRPRRRTLHDRAARTYVAR